PGAWLLSPVVDRKRGPFVAYQEWSPVSRQWLGRNRYPASGLPRPARTSVAGSALKCRDRDGPSRVLVCRRQSAIHTAVLRVDCHRAVVLPAAPSKSVGPLPI